ARAAAALPGEGRFGWLTLPTSAEQAAHTIAGTLEMVELRRAAAERAKAAHRYQGERTPPLDAARAPRPQPDGRQPLPTILAGARHITGADAGSVYVLEHSEGESERVPVLHFMLSQNDSMNIDFSEHRLPVDGESIVGAAVLARKPINVADLSALASPQ